MEKQKRWQLVLILTVLLVTLYNVFPTVIYYSRPLRQPIDQEQAEKVVENIATRVNKLEEDAKEWVGSLSNMLGVSPTSVEVDKDDPSLIRVAFASKSERQRFVQVAPIAGETIPFVPAQLTVYDIDKTGNMVILL